MLNAVKNFIKENNLSNKTILLGLSGGIDSSVLCDILSKIEGIKLVIIHLNHNWRGADSKRDEEFAYNLSKKIGADFYSETLDSKTKKSETTAREFRYDFYKKCKEKFKGDAVFLAHNKNDNVETLLYRLIKGTGPSGLTSIPKVRDFYYRPLLDFSRKEIEIYAEENNVKYVIDKSNFDTKYKRNLIREKIIPEMEKINKEAISSISTFIKVNKMTQEIVDKKVQEVLCEIQEGDTLLMDKFLSTENEIQYEIMNRFLKGILKTRDFKTIEKIVNFIKENKSSKISLNKDCFLKIYDNKIYVMKKETGKKEGEVGLKIGKNKFLNFTLTLTEVPVPKDFKKNTGAKYLKLDFKNKYKIRTRKTGDFIQPFGQKEAQKLKTFLIKKKIPSEKRGRLPLIALGDEILFIPYSAISEKLRVDINDKTCYKLTIKED